MEETKLKGSSSTIKANSSKRKTRETKLMKYLNSKGFGIAQSSEIVALFSNKSSFLITRGTIHPHKTAGKNDIEIDQTTLSLDRSWIDGYLSANNIKPNKDEL